MVRVQPIVVDGELRYTVVDWSGEPIVRRPDGSIWSAATEDEVIAEYGGWFPSLSAEGGAA